MELNKQDFQLLRDYIHRIIGLAIMDEKQYLIKQRLEPVVKKAGCTTFLEFYQKLKEAPSGHLNKEIVSAITTNETSFFRDIHPFETFSRHILPELFKRIIARKERQYVRTGPKVRIWCAASSTGQEPYCLAILIYESLKHNPRENIYAADFSVLATDISPEVLAKAMTGEYDEAEVNRGLPLNLKQRYFHSKGSNWTVKEELHRLVEFKRLNLIEPFTDLGSFDVIFCRNVLIYFDMETRRKIIDQFNHMLTTNGFLVLGSSENLYGLESSFKSTHFGSTIVYRENK
ncbi:MAG: protein-glutamate O-methyltransferase CheR [bacterium]|nr:protein-glutamate O-methyltransferase CheR [bacterium]